MSPILISFNDAGEFSKTFPTIGGKEMIPEKNKNKNKTNQAENILNKLPPSKTNIFLKSFSELNESVSKSMVFEFWNIFSRPFILT